MPRLNLTNEEVLIVEEHRRKNAEITAFNAGLDRAREIFEHWRNSPEVHLASALAGERQPWEAFHEAIQSERKQARR